MEEDRFPDLLGKRGVVLETIREWLVIIIAIFLFMLYGLSVLRVHRRHQAFTFDMMVLCYGVSNVLALVIEEFALRDSLLYFYLLAADMILELLIFANLMRASLQMQMRTSLIRSLLFPYFIFCFLLILALCIAGPIVDQEDIRENHEGVPSLTLQISAIVLDLIDFMLILKNMWPALESGGGWRRGQTQRTHGPVRHSGVDRRAAPLS